MNPSSAGVVSKPERELVSVAAERNNLLLEVKNLKVYFALPEGVVRAVDGVSFSVAKGETVGIIGESGSGKSVTVQSILRILPSPPARIVGGEILFYPSGDGPAGKSIDLAKLDPFGESIRRIRGKEISMIFQEPMTAFSPVYTIGNQIMEVILVHERQIGRKQAREQTIGLLSKVGIPRPERLIDVYPHQLSGGMRQRAMIAMALACGPKLLIADEPTTALDVTIQSQILDLLQELQGELGMTMLYISHDLDVVAELADQAIVMYLGSIAERASVEELLEMPLHPYTQGLLRSTPRVDEDVDRLIPLRGSIPNPYEVQHGCPFASRCDHYMDGICDRTKPLLREEKAGHHVSCFLYENVASAAVPRKGQGG